MRTSLIPGGLSTLAHNVSLGTNHLKIFETGKVFIARGPSQLPREIETLTALWSGPRRPAGASPSAVATLARSPVAVHEFRLPRKAADHVLAACNEARWLGPVHVAMTAVEATRGHSR